MASDRAALLAPVPVKTERVAMPEFGNGHYVVMHGCTAKEWNRYQNALMKSDWSGINQAKARTQRERLVIQCARDDNGQRIFTNEDIDAIGEWPAELLNRLYDVANRLNGGTDTGEETAKNSAGTDGD